LQSRVTTINQLIAAQQTLITERQNAIADLNNLIANTTDQNLINGYNQKIAGLNDDINNNIQPIITQLQSKIAAIPTLTADVQAELSVIDNRIADAQGTVAKETALAQQQQLISQNPGYTSAQPAASNAITTPRNPNNPNGLPLFQTTGNAQQDANLIRQWLVAHPIAK
jgi:chromosome segregation ATPase